MYSVSPAMSEAEKSGIRISACDPGRYCDGFRTLAHLMRFHAHGRAGVRKPPGNGVTGDWAPDGSAGSMGISLARPAPVEISRHAAIHVLAGHPAAGVAV